MSEITGQLIGGPDDGNLVSASSTEIAVEDTMSLWLDGQDKSPCVVRIKGRYVWQEEKYYFKWYPESNEVLEAA